MRALPCTGMTNVEVTKEIMATRPKQFVLDQVGQLSITQILGGNIDYKLSDANVRQKRSRGLAQQDQDKDDYQDLLEIKRNFEANDIKYIQKVYDEPFNVILINELNLKLLAERKWGAIENCNLHIDATGSVVRKFRENQKAVYYYSICIRTPPINDRDTGNLVDLGSMISSSHTQITIGNFLAVFKAKCMEYFKKWPFFKHAISDFSYATINAMLLNFESTTLSSYIREKFKQYKYGLMIPENSFTIHLCAAHLIKNFTTTVKTFKFGVEESKNLKKIFGTFFRIYEWKQLLEFISLFFCLLLNPFKDGDFQKTLENLNKYTMSAEINSLELSDTATGKHSSEGKDSENDEKNDIYEEENEKVIKTIYKSSPFYQLCCEIQNQKEETYKTSLGNHDSNPYFNKKFLEELKKKFFAFIPLWINITDVPSLVSKFFFLKLHSIIPYHIPLFTINTNQEYYQLHA